ncbi:DUF5118 domain-containing protein [Algoriphagus hitonicola]|uniref:DUF5118 domain-containing protein n=1 Tax=Algoriphagus hitonicola TaxID=435880 RepID=UPI0036152614
MKKTATTILLALLSILAIQAQNLDLSKMEKKEGFIDFYLEPDKGKIYLEIDQLENEFLYVNSLTAGVGSNDLGLDRDSWETPVLSNLEKPETNYF